MKISLLILIIFSGLISLPTYAKKRQKRTFFASSLAYINRTHKFISSHWVDLNYDFDVYFSDNKYKRSKNKSKLVASYEVYKHEDSDFQNAFDFKIRIHLPNISKRLSIVFEKERDRIVESRSNTATRSQANDNNNYNAGVSYLVHKSKFWKTSFDTGIRLTLPLNPFAKFKAYHETKFSFINIYLGQEVIFYRHEGLRELTQIHFSKKINDKFHISQNNVLSWTDDTDDFVLRNALNLSHRIDHKRTLSYNTGANAYLSPSYYYYRYDASITYHRLLYKKWLYGNFSVGAEFNKKNDFEMKNFALIRFDVLFL